MRYPRFRAALLGSALLAASMFPVVAWAAVAPADPTDLCTFLPSDPGWSVRTAPENRASVCEAEYVATDDGAPVQVTITRYDSPDLARQAVAVADPVMERATTAFGEGGKERGADGALGLDFSRGSFGVSVVPGMNPADTARSAAQLIDQQLIAVVGGEGDTQVAQTAPGDLAPPDRPSSPIDQPGTAAPPTSPSEAELTTPAPVAIPDLGDRPDVVLFDDPSERARMEAEFQLTSEKFWTFVRGRSLPDTYQAALNVGKDGLSALRAASSSGRLTVLQKKAMQWRTLARMLATVKAPDNESMFYTLRISMDMVEAMSNRPDMDDPALENLRKMVGFLVRYDLRENLGAYR